MKKVLSLIIALSLALSTAVAPVAFAATPAKTTAPTIQQVKDLFTKYRNGIFSGDSNTFLNYVIDTPENKEDIARGVEGYIEIKKYSTHYNFISTVNYIQPIKSSDKQEYYSYYIESSLFIATNNFYTYATQKSFVNIKYDTVSKTFKILDDKNISSDSMYDISKLPNLKELLKVVENFGKEYIGLVKEGKQPDETKETKETKEWIIQKLISKQKEVPLKLENTYIVDNELFVCTTEGQTASITIDLKNHVGVYDQLEIFPITYDPENQIQVEIIANGVSKGVTPIDSMYLYYELFEDKQVQLIFSANKPFAIQGLNLTSVK